MHRLHSVVDCSCRPLTISYQKSQPSSHLSRLSRVLLVPFIFLVPNADACMLYTRAPCFDSGIVTHETKREECFVRDERCHSHPMTPLVDILALSEFATTCDANNWQKPNSNLKVNWCDGIVSNDACVDGAKVVRDPCYGDLIQTPDQAIFIDMWVTDYMSTVEQRSLNSWDGVTCSGGTVSALHLEQYNIGARNSTNTTCELGNFDLSPIPSLDVINFDHNFIEGTIPSWVASAPRLRKLSMVSNRLSGSLPFDIFTGEYFGSLESVNLNFNRLTGHIPLLGMFTSSLHLSNNLLSGPLLFPLISALNTIDIGYNRLTGTIPSISHHSLQSFVAPGNLFTGPLLGMDGSGGLKYILEIDLSDNFLTGPIHPALSTFPFITTLKLGGNAFSGALPSLPRTLTEATFMGPGSRFFCPFPDFNSLWATVTCNCTAGHFCPASNRSNCQNTCRKCPAGTASSKEWAVGAGECSDCPKGTYAAKGGTGVCLDCPPLKYQDVPGQTFCHTVLMGSYFVSATQQPRLCPAGTFSETEGAAVCTSCPAGRLSAPNNVFGTGAYGCVDCRGGRFAPTAASLECTLCPAGTFSETEGAVICTSCPAGRLSAPNNVFGTGTYGCVDCPGGRFAPTAASLECTLFPRGYASSDTGRIAVNPASDACHRGKYQNLTGQTACVLAPAGRYVPQSPSATNPTAYTKAIACPAGTSTSRPGAWVVLGGHPCTTCPEGHYQAQTGQTACDLAPAGHYVPNFPSNTESIACPAGSYASKAGSARCITCPGGRYQPQTGQTTCIQASAGRYVPHSTDPTAAAESIACPAGSYTSVRGSRECRSCPVGHYQSTPGSAYGPGSGQGCFLCPPGMVAVSSRSKACSYCPGLKYPNKPEGGATQCVGACGKGAIVLAFDDKGNPWCQECPINTFEAETTNGFGECVRCPVGYGTAGLTKASSCSPLIPLNRTDDDADKDAIMVVGFDLSDPKQKGLFFSVVGVIVLIFLCAGIFVGQVAYKASADRRRAHERMSRVSRGIWEESFLCSIPEHTQNKEDLEIINPLLHGEENSNEPQTLESLFGWKSSYGPPTPPPCSVPAPTDNPYKFVKKKKLKSKSARKAVEAAFFSELLKDNPPAGSRAFVVVAPSAPVRKEPTLPPTPGSLEVCRKFKGDVVYVSQATAGWVQLHIRHGERHGGGGWMSIRRAPILPPLGVGMIVTSDSNVDEEVGQESDTTSLLFGDIPSNKLGGMMRQAIDGASAWGRGSIYPRWTEPISDGFTPKKGDHDSEAEFYLVPCDLDALKKKNIILNPRATAIDNESEEASTVVHSQQGLMSLRPGALTLVLNGVGAEVDKQNKGPTSWPHHQAPLWSNGQSWWVSLTESLGLFADDGDAEKDAREALRLANEAQASSEADEIASIMAKSPDSSSGHMISRKDTARVQVLMRKAKDRAKADNASGKLLGRFVGRLKSAASAISGSIVGDSDVGDARLGYVDDRDREMTSALLAERANVSVLRVIRVPDAKSLPDGMAPSRPPGGSHLPTADEGLTRPPIDIPDVPDEKFAAKGNFADIDNEEEADSIRYEVMVERLAVKALPNIAYKTEKVLHKGSVVVAVEARGGWVNLKGETAGVSGGWAPVSLTDSDESAGGVVVGAIGRTKFNFNDRKFDDNQMNELTTARVVKRISLSLFSAAFSSPLAAEAASGDEVDKIDKNKNTTLESGSVLCLRMLVPGEMPEGQAAKKSALEKGALQDRQTKKKKKTKKQHPQEWRMPKRVAVVRVRDEAAALNCSRQVEIGGQDSCQDDGANVEVTYPTCPHSLPAVFAIHRDVKSSPLLPPPPPLLSFSTETSASPFDDFILSDLPPLDLPLAPQPCPAGLSLLDMDIFQNTSMSRVLIATHAMA